MDMYVTKWLAESQPHHIYFYANRSLPPSFDAARHEIMRGLV